VLRITAERENGDRTSLKLEGRVVGPWVAELSRRCEAAGASGRFELEMSGVSFLDPDAVRLLRGLIEQGIDLRRCSAFVREQLRGGQDEPIADR
jgi:hypothetical protein